MAARRSTGLFLFSVLGVGAALFFAGNAVAGEKKPGVSEGIGGPNDWYHVSPDGVIAVKPDKQGLVYAILSDKWVAPVQEQNAPSVSVSVMPATVPQTGSASAAAALPWIAAQCQAGRHVIICINPARSLMAAVFPGEEKAWCGQNRSEKWALLAEAQPTAGGFPIPGGTGVPGVPGVPTPPGQPWTPPAPGVPTPGVPAAPSGGSIVLPGGIVIPIPGVPGSTVPGGPTVPAGTTTTPPPAPPAPPAPPTPGVEVPPLSGTFPIPGMPGGGIPIPGVPGGVVIPGYPGGATTPTPGTTTTPPTNMGPTVPTSTGAGPWPAAFVHTIRPGDIASRLAEHYTGNFLKAYDLQKLNKLQIVGKGKDTQFVPWKVGQVLALPLDWNVAKGPPGVTAYALKKAISGKPATVAGDDEQGEAFGAVEVARAIKRAERKKARKVKP